MSLIPDFYLKTVVAIGERRGSETFWVGTGFFVMKEVGEGKYQPFMVTNKHVLKGKEKLVLRFKKKSSNKLITEDVPIVEKGRCLYSVHPDPNVDVAVVLLVGRYFEKNGLELIGFNVFNPNQALTSSEYIKEGGGEGCGIFMLGYPMGLVDVESNMPICRGGYIARMESNEIKRTKSMLLDIQNFPGNSGSPIITKPEVVSIEGTKALTRSVLIGVVHSYIPYQETLINSQTGKIVEIRSENSGIAKANPVEFIREVIELELQRMSNPIP